MLYNNLLEIISDKIINKEIITIKCSKCDIIANIKVNSLKEMYRQKKQQPYELYICKKCIRILKSKKPNAPNSLITLNEINKYSRNSKAVLKCEKCNVDTLIKIESICQAINAGRITDKFICGKCRMPKLTQEHFEATSKRMKKLWAKGHFNKLSETIKNKFKKDETYSQRISEGLKKRYKEDKEYRKKVSNAAQALNQDPQHIEMKRNRALKQWEDNREELMKIFNDDEWSRKMSIQSKQAWMKYRDRFMKIYASEKFRNKCSQNMIKLWLNDEYRNKAESMFKSEEFRLKSKIIAKIIWQDIDFKNMMLEIYRSEEYRNKMSEISKQNWQNEEYKNKMLTIMTSKEFRKKSSEIQKNRWMNDHKNREIISQKIKRLWEDDDYRNKIMNKMSVIRNTEEYRKKQSEHSKRRWDDPKYREKMAQVRANQLCNISSIQKQLYKYLDDLNVDYYKEGENTRIGHYVFDCLIKTSDDKRDILIECQGDYWHNLENIKCIDQSKFTYIDRYFPEYEIMYIWEHEFYTKDWVLARLKNKLNIDVNVIDFNFNDVIIRECSASDYRSFLDAYHYIGKGRGGKCYGAYVDDELIACAVFSNSLRQNMGRYGDFRELSRFCIHPSYHKKNFASWFISKLIKIVDVKKIIAYADSTVGHVGTIYKASNFKFDHLVRPDYWYVNKDGFVMHKKTLYNRATRCKMSEFEFANEYGYVKKYGGYKYCYVYEKK